MQARRKIAVAGATGRVGRHVVDVLEAGGHDVVAMSRSGGVDVITGDGLAQALAGAECVIGDGRPAARSGRHPRRPDVRGVARLHVLTCRINLMARRRGTRRPGAWLPRSARSRGAADSFQALRRANPRAKAGFARSLEAAADTLHAQIVTTPADVAMDAGAPGPRGGRPRPRRRLVRVSAAGVSLVAAVAVAAFLTVGSPSVGNAAVAVRKAATVTAASAERSGTAVVRITHNGRVWAGTTIRWHNRDLAVARDAPRRPGKVGSFLVVGGALYGIDPIDGGWVKLGSPASIDPDSGTTPSEYLAAVREDVGGVTLRRIIDGMTGLTARRLGDGSTVCSGTVAAGLIARESGFKEGHPIRVLPFGYVAHDEAVDPAAPLRAAVTVDADGIVREIAVTWGTSASAWTYTVTYSRLGATPAPVAPANARPLNVVRRQEAATGRTSPVTYRASGFLPPSRPTMIVVAAHGWAGAEVRGHPQADCPRVRRIGEGHAASSLQPQQPGRDRCVERRRMQRGRRCGARRTR